ncbi:MAG: hypothetical protein GF419_08260 [Ignavibacteriales bacterium]|nr:hypothetical protein [Ignavibacteriales bacterium]
MAANLTSIGNYSPYATGTATAKSAATTSAARNRATAFGEVFELERAKTSELERAASFFADPSVAKSFQAPLLGQIIDRRG